MIFVNDGRVILDLTELHQHKVMHGFETAGEALEDLLCDAYADFYGRGVPIPSLILRLVDGHTAKQP